MEEKREQEMEEKVPEMEMKIGNKTIVIGIHFSEDKKVTLHDKVKHMIRQEVQNGTFS